MSKNKKDCLQNPHRRSAAGKESHVFKF